MTLYFLREKSKNRASTNDPPISESDTKLDKLGLELVIPVPSPPWPPSPGQSASGSPKSQKCTHLNPPNAPPVVQSGAQPSGSGQPPARPEPPVPQYSLRPTKEHLACQTQPSGENINAILANIFQEVPNSY